MNIWRAPLVVAKDVRLNGLALKKDALAPRQRSAMQGCSRGRIGLLFCLFGFAALDADTLSQGCRLDADRHACPDRCDRGLLLGLPEENPTAGRKLIPAPDHAGRDAIDVWNVGAAKPKRIAGAGRLLFGSIGPAC